MKKIQLYGNNSKYNNIVYVKALGKAVVEEEALLLIHDILYIHSQYCIRSPCSVA